MKVVLYMAVSIDGFIAKKDGDSDWVSETDTINFEKKVAETGCIVVGNRTFKQYKDELYPIENATNIILTSHKALKSENRDVVYAHSPADALEVASGRGQDKILLVGGGITNGLFLKDKLIDELILTVHPLLLGNGIRLFENPDCNINLQLLTQNKLAKNLIQIHYKIIR